MDRMDRRALCEAFGVKDITTQRMLDAIDEWYGLYYDWNIPCDEDNSQRMAFTVVSKLSKTIFSEYEATSENEYLNSFLEAVEVVRKKLMQQSLIGGTAWLKPIVYGDELTFTVVTRDNVVIAGRDRENNVIDMITEEKTEYGGDHYTLMERRHIEDGRLIISSKLYRSDDKDSKGKRVPLNALEKYEGIEPEIELPIDNIGLIPLACPAENCVDGSDDAVSVFAPATDLIHRINHNEYQLNVEFDNGESRIMVSNDLMKPDKNGVKQLSDHIFTAIDDDPENVGIVPYAPALRTESFLARKREYMRNIESLIGFKRGILSEVEAAERTATEITSSAGDYNLTIIDFQQEWEKALRKAAEVTAELLKVYKKGTPSFTDDDLIISWGNGVLYDADKTWAEYIQMVAAGLLKPELAVAWYFDLPHSTPQDLEQIRAEYMPQLAMLTEGV